MFFNLLIKRKKISSLVYSKMLISKHINWEFVQNSCLEMLPGKLLCSAVSGMFYIYNLQMLIKEENIILVNKRNI